MTAMALPRGHASAYPVNIRVEPVQGERDRLTTAFRIILAFPHLLLVGGPAAFGLSLAWSDGPVRFDWGMGGGVLGAVAGVCAVIAWFSLLFVGVYPEGLRSLAVFYLRWRVRAVAYTALLRDEYPPFGDGDYPAVLDIDTPTEPRDRVSVAFRIILALPHLICVWALGLAWAVTSFIAWVSILTTGRYPEALQEFAVGVFRWNTRVEAYLLLLTDEYPPFALE
jgi:hypothetical protein